MSCTEQKDEVYLNLVLDFVPETVYRVARHFNKAKSIIPIIYVKVNNLLFAPHLFLRFLWCSSQLSHKMSSLHNRYETLNTTPLPLIRHHVVFSFSFFILCCFCELLRCTCTSCFAVWLISIPRVCVTETSSHRTCLSTQKLPSSSCVTLAGELHKKMDFSHTEIEDLTVKSSFCV